MPINVRRRSTRRRNRSVYETWEIVTLLTTNCDGRCTQEEYNTFIDLRNSEGGVSRRENNSPKVSIDGVWPVWSSYEVRKPDA